MPARHLKAPVSDLRRFSVSSNDMAARSGPKVWWMKAQHSTFQLPTIFRLTNGNRGDYGQTWTHFDGGGRPEGRGADANRSRGVQPRQRSGCGWRWGRGAGLSF